MVETSGTLESEIPRLHDFYPIITSFETLSKLLIFPEFRDHVVFLTGLFKDKMTLYNCGIERDRKIYMNMHIYVCI